MVKNSVRLALALLLVPLCGGVGSVQAEQRSPLYWSYVHSYPHQVPSDYVYRTERVFAPPADGGFWGWLKGLGKEEPAAVAQVPAGELLQARVASLVEQLLGSATEEVRDNYVVTVCSFVNANELYATSSLGRFLSEQMITELQKAGVEGVEVRKTPSIMVSSNDGVYGLSTDMDELSFVHNAQAMVTGTYAVAGGQVFVNARLLRNSDGMVLASGSLAFALDDASAAMLADEGMPARAGKPVAIRAFVDKESAKR